MYKLSLTFLVSFLLCGCSGIKTTQTMLQPESLREIHDPLEEVRIAMRMAPENLAQAYSEYTLASPDQAGEFTIIGHSINPSTSPACLVETNCIARLIVRGAKVGQDISVLTLFLPQYATLRRCAWTATFSKLSPETDGFSDILSQHGLNLAKQCWQSQTKSNNSTN